MCSCHNFNRSTSTYIEMSHWEEIIFYLNIRQHFDFEIVYKNKKEGKEIRFDET